MPSKERAGGKELEIMKSISTQGGRRPGNFASRMPTTWEQIGSLGRSDRRDSLIQQESFVLFRSQCAYDVAPGGLLASVYHLTRIEDDVDQPEEEGTLFLSPTYCSSLNRSLVFGSGKRTTGCGRKERFCLSSSK
ncbi:hypothetical protein KY290_031150 [Solanum tuberosum]|uniref:Uncharacterized protein n=1 Tax=Solanum tuberosum TaxID=4113 RepID=A0ABQ7U8B6_SOLTU|nr:hypothetical protein KY290_031150 [Solanum tuberosum]